MVFWSPYIMACKCRSKPTILIKPFIYIKSIYTLWSIKFLFDHLKIYVFNTTSVLLLSIIESYSTIYRAKSYYNMSYCMGPSIWCSYRVTSHELCSYTATKYHMMKYLHGYAAVKLPQTKISMQVHRYTDPNSPIQI